MSFDDLTHSLRYHWPEYVIEGTLLGLFMVSAAVFTTIFEYPGSPLHQAIQEPVIRRVLIGVAMGLTAVALIYSPWGQQSGAHMNPAVTLSFLRLGKIDPWDAVFYIISQFIGGTIGVVLMVVLLGQWFELPPVSYVATVPGEDGTNVALLVEVMMSFGMMMMVLFVSNSRSWNKYTGMFAGLVVATYISVLAPYSGMSINPARTFASAAPGDIWTSFWIYLVGPPLGMLVAAQIFYALNGRQEPLCAKLNHSTHKRCIFRCNFSVVDVP